MNIHKYINDKEIEFLLEQRRKCDIIMDYLKRVIKNKEFTSQIASKDSVEQYENLNGWLFNFYPKEFFKALNIVGINREEYYKKLLAGFMLTIVYENNSANDLFNLFRKKRIINDLYLFSDAPMELFTPDYGKIQFGKALDIFKNDKEFVEKIEKLGKRSRTLCHELTYYALERYPNRFKAATTICVNGNNLKYYHSFLIDNQNYVIDLANNIYMPKEYYYLLDVEKELNIVTLEEAKKETLETRKYDSNDTIYELLRNAVYKEYKSTKKKQKILKK